MKTKTFFKILAMGIVLMLLAMTFGTYSFAAINQDTKGTITVTGLEPGIPVSIYKIASVNVATNGQPTSEPYTWDEKILQWFDEAGSAYASYEDFETFSKVTDDSTEAQAFYDALAAAIRGGDITGFTPTKTDNADGDLKEGILADDGTIDTSHSVTFTDRDMGLYLVIVENGYKVYSAAAARLLPTATGSDWNLTSGELNVNTAVKSSKPAIEKSVTAEGTKADNFATNATMTFTVVADVPKYLDSALAKNYYISDKFANGTIDTNSITVKGVPVEGGEDQPLEKDKAYSVKQDTTGTDIGTRDADFLLDFNYDQIKSYKQIKVTYTATLNKDTTLTAGTTGNSNNAYLDYSNNPYVATSNETQESTTTVYTYGIDVSKVDKTTGDPITESAATFNLMSGGSALYFVQGTNPGEYYLANQGEPNAKTDLVVDGNAELHLRGLDEGTYSLKEITAPNGYNIATEELEVVLTDAESDGRLDGQVGGQDVDPNGTGIATVEFENSKGFTLPVTGGMGTVVFVATGIVVAGLGITLLMVVFKKNRATK